MFVDNWFDDMTRVSRFKMSKKSNDFGLEDTLTRTKKVKMPSTNTSFFDDRYIDNEMAKFQYHNEFLADVDEFDKKYMPNIDFSHTDPQLYQYKLKGKTMNDLIMDKVRGIDPTVESGDNGMVANRAKVLATLRKGGSSSTSTSSSSGGGGKGTGAVHIDDESGVGGGGGGVLSKVGSKSSSIPVKPVSVPLVLPPEDRRDKSASDDDEVSTEEEGDEEKEDEEEEGKKGERSPKIHIVNDTTENKKLATDLIKIISDQKNEYLLDHPTGNTKVSKFLSTLPTQAEKSEFGVKFLNLFGFAAAKTLKMKDIGENLFIIKNGVKEKTMLKKLGRRNIELLPQGAVRTPRKDASSSSEKLSITSPEALSMASGFA